MTANNDRTKDFTKHLPAIAPDVQTTPSGSGSGLQPGGGVRAPNLQPGGGLVGAQFVPGMAGIGGANDFYAQQAAAAAAAAAAQQQNVYFPNAFMNSSSSHHHHQFNSVLLVSNLNEEKINCTALFNLFSSYGNVLRVKILHNKPDHALVQMGDYTQASTAMHYLKVTLFFLTVSFSSFSPLSIKEKRTNG